MKIFLIRHGQTTGDLEDRYGGDYDDHLSEEGQTQAEQLARSLRKKGIQIIFASPLIRARETARILQTRLDCEVKTIDNLRERNQYGVLTGLIKSEAQQQYPKLVEEVKDYRNTIQGAEPYEQFKERIEQVWNELLESPEQTIAVVAHGGPIRVIFRESLKSGEINISDCAYAELDYTNKSLTVTNLSGISHV